MAAAHNSNLNTQQGQEARQYIRAEESALPKLKLVALPDATGSLSGSRPYPLVKQQVEHAP